MTKEFELNVFNKKLEQTLTLSVVARSLGAAISEAQNTAAKFWREPTSRGALYRVEVAK